MSTETSNGSKSRFLKLSVAELFSEAYTAVESRNIDKLRDIDILLKRDFCKKTTGCLRDKLDDFNKHMVNFISWFEWGGVPKWEKAAEIVGKWKTILELSQLIAQTESPLKAFKEIKKSSYGEKLVRLLYEKKIMKPMEIKVELKINAIQQVSNMLSAYEKLGVIVREVDGKNVWVSLGIQGMAVYKEYIKPPLSSMSTRIIQALREYESKNLGKAIQILREVKQEEPNNPFAVCLLGIVTLDNGDLEEAGKLIYQSVKLGIDKEWAFLVFYILEQMKRLESLKNDLFNLNWQKDEISRQVQPSLHLLALLMEYKLNKPRAKEYERLSYARF
ncbi:MAG: hypothetical protein PVH61_36895 [Candidatus Aminicenantes bacterium]|jgi:hypothetical protein